MDPPLETTAKYMDRISAALDQIKDEFIDPGSGESLIRNVSKTTGAFSPERDFDKSRGYLSVEVLLPDDRSEPGPRCWKRRSRPVASGFVPSSSLP